MLALVVLPSRIRTQRLPVKVRIGAAPNASLVKTLLERTLLARVVFQTRTDAAPNASSVETMLEWTLVRFQSGWNCAEKVFLGKRENTSRYICPLPMRHLKRLRFEIPLPLGHCCVHRATIPKTLPGAPVFLPRLQNIMDLVQGRNPNRRRSDWEKLTSAASGEPGLASYIRDGHDLKEGVAFGPTFFQSFSVPHLRS